MNYRCRYQCISCKADKLYEIEADVPHSFLLQERRRLRKGLYGERARQIITENRHAAVTAEPALYRCNCGYMEADYRVRLSSSKARTYTVRRHCPVCDRLMSIQDPLKMIPCPQCGGRMFSIREN